MSETRTSTTIEEVSAELNGLARGQLLQVARNAERPSFAKMLRADLSLTAAVMVLAGFVAFGLYLIAGLGLAYIASAGVWLAIVPAVTCVIAAASTTGVRGRMSHF